jgi:L-serine dehydratase
MAISAFQLFKIGVGPSSSHTVGPMLAARRFVALLAERGLLGNVAGITVDLYGSLALTGRGHASDTAIVAGLAGQWPDATDAASIAAIWARAAENGRLALPGGPDIAFDIARDLRFRQRERKPYHSNALRLCATDGDGALLAERLYYSIGGGFVVDEDEAGRNADGAEDELALPFAFTSGAEMLAMGEASGLTIAEMMLANELAREPEQAVIDARLDGIADVMAQCIDAGMAAHGVLPGGLNVRRRAPGIAADIRARHDGRLAEPLAVLDWINLWAMAVNEENAAGGRVVTAPTNGAAGIIPAVIRYYERCYRGTPAGVRTFLLTAAAIGALYKRNASISGAEVGCQGEVGVACSMAAAGLTAALGGCNRQIENAAEIGMEHNLGLTCDPIGGLVQIPCIERNAMGAIKAIDASRIAMMGDGTHMVSLDKVIATMWQTGRDMRDKYKETSKGGLAVNVVEC